MKGWLVVAPLALLVASLPVASSETVVEDPSGDIIADTPAGPVAIPGTANHLDLLSLGVDEAEETLTIVVERAGEPVTPIDGGHYKVGFQFSDTEYRILVDQVPAYSGSAGSAFVQRRPVGSENWANVGPATATFEGPKMKLAFGKEIVTDGVGLPLVQGNQLVTFWATSIDYNSDTTVVGPVPSAGAITRLQDTMPKDGPAGEYLIQLGAKSGPSLLLTTLRPIRSSNGEQTTIVFDVTATNRADPVEISFSATDGPTNWDVTFLHQAIRLDAGEQQSVPVVVAIPFAHEHGSTYAFNVTAKDVDSGDTLATLRLGVHYLDVPQPAGHHDTLFFHVDSGDNPSKPLLGNEVSARFGYMTTLSEDELDRGVSMSPTGFTSDFPAAQYGSVQPTSFTWCVRLDDALKLGLDFDTSRQGQWSAAVSSGAAMSGTLSARLLATATAGDNFHAASRCGDKPVLELARIQDISVDLTGRGANHDISEAVSSLVEELTFVEGRSLLWEATLIMDNQTLIPYQVDYPVLKAASTLRLPLNEYHERPPIIANNAAQLALSSPPRVLRNPGSTAVFNLTLEKADSDFQLSILGTNKDWASLSREKASSGDKVFVIVKVPKDEYDGNVADLIIKASGNGELALAHVVVEVDTDSIHPNEKSLAEAVDKSIGFLGLGLVVLALGGLAGIRRP